MFNPPSLLRHAELKVLSEIKLNGKVLDLGGVKDSSYIHSFEGNFFVTVVNMDEKTSPDIMHDLEAPLPVSDGEYNHVLLINVLEHIFEYRNLILESFRVLKPGGKIVIVVPFIFPVHPSPEDHHRFTGSALQLELERDGFKDIKITPMGMGVFSAVYLFIDRLLPKFFRFFNYYTIRYLVSVLDITLFKFTQVLGRKYLPSDYALGFCAVAQKK